MSLFKSLANEPSKNCDYLFLLLITACKAVFDKKLECFRTLICNTAEPEKIIDDSTIERDRFVQIFEALFTLCSVMALNEIQGSTYELENDEIYNEEELDLIKKSVKKSVSEFADDFFKDRTEAPFNEF